MEQAIQYTGLVNLGNSCYLAAAMQVVFSTKSFLMRTKLAHGLLSGQYLVPATKEDDVAGRAVSSKQKGIPPRTFKAVIASSHPEFRIFQLPTAIIIFITNDNIIF